jgi:N-acetylmuramoyl-L-alanine amidase
VHRWRIALAVVFGMVAANALAKSPASDVRPRERFDTVVVDAGHGGEDEGATGVRGLVEKDLVLDVARRLTARLRKHDLRVVMTREDDRFVPLEERFAIANDARGDLFISIHANATKTDGVSGVETFFLSVDASDDEAHRVALLENQAFAAPGAMPEMGDSLNAILGDLIASDYLMESNEFARLAQHHLAEDEANRSRGVKQAPFVVLQGVQMPSTLVEIGFITNPAEAKRLRSSRERERIAAALVAAVLEFGERFDARRGVAGGDSRGVAVPARPAGDER